MTEARVPVLLPHLELHAQLLREVDRMRRDIASRDAEGARQLIGTLLPQLVANHVATADAVSASFLKRLRLSPLLRNDRNSAARKRAGHAETAYAQSAASNSAWRITRSTAAFCRSGG